MTSIFDVCPRHRYQIKDESCPFNSFKGFGNELQPEDYLIRFEKLIKSIRTLENHPKIEITRLIQSINTGICPFNCKNTSDIHNTTMPCLFHPKNAIDCPIFRDGMDAKPNESFVDCLIRKINT